MTNLRIGSKVDKGFTNESCQLHEQGQGQRQAKAFWIRQRQKIWHVPHQEKESKATDGDLPRNTRKFICMNELVREKQEDGSSLQIPRGDESNQEAGNPNTHLSPNRDKGLIVAPVIITPVIVLILAFIVPAVIAVIVVVARILLRVIIVVVQNAFIGVNRIVFIPVFD